MISAIVLAAGGSARMGSPKALLDWRGLPFIEHVCAALRAAGVEDRVVVLGRDSARILSAWRPAGERIAVNERPEDGQLSSLRVGLAAAGKKPEAFLVCLADQPTIKAETYAAVMAAWRLHRGSIVIPRVPRGGRREGGPAFKRGHPIIIPAACSRLCFDGPLDKGLHWVTHHPSVDVFDLDTSDRGIMRDFDTPEDYEELRGGGA